MATTILTSAALRGLAPEAFAALDAVRASVDGAADPALVTLARQTVGAVLGVERPAGPSLGEGEGEDAGALGQVIEQFVIDVSATTDAQRAALLGRGADGFGLAQVLYVLDYSTRLDAAWDQLFGVAVPPQAPLEPAPSLWAALESFFSAVARLGGLDPVTTELVRLRGARAHNCRLCKSRRSVGAAAAGADEPMYDQIDHFETSDLSARHKVALRLTDAILWQPGSYPPGLAGEVRDLLSTPETVEIVLDVARNAANKIAVVLGADAPNVTDGVEYYDVDERGELVSGLQPPAPNA